jgi:ATP-dependent exoDNAse (exonuclease V) beta subunit
MSNVPNKPELDKIHQLYGIVDLLVIDKKGNSYIFDYKTSPKEYQNYNSAKKLEFNY